MTLPNERRNAVDRAREFLRSLLDPKKTPRVPLAVRREARDVLKHYPAEWEMRIASKKVPEFFGDG